MKLFGVTCVLLAACAQGAESSPPMATNAVPVTSAAPAVVDDAVAVNPPATVATSASSPPTEPSRGRHHKPATTDFETNCETSRPARVASLQAAIRAYADQHARDQATLAWATQHCKMVDTRGIAVTHETVDGQQAAVARPVGDQDTLKCDATKGRPRELTSNWYLAHNIDDSNLGYDDTNAGDSGLCEKFDAASPTGSLRVLRGDAAGANRVMALPAPTAQ